MIKQSTIRKVSSNEKNKNEVLTNGNSNDVMVNFVDYNKKSNIMLKVYEVNNTIPYQYIINLINLIIFNFISYITLNL